MSGVFYTHFHGDHIGDLNNIITWLSVRTWANNYAGDTTRLPVFTIYGPAGLVTYVQNLYKYASLPSMPPCVQFVEVAPNETITLDNCSVTVFKVPHTAESVGYRFTFANGKTLAISGDTAYNNLVINLIKNVDVAVLECSYDDDFHQKTKHEVHHLSPTTAAQLAQQAGAKIDSDSLVCKRRRCRYCRHSKQILCRHGTYSSRRHDHFIRLKKEIHD